MAKRINKPEQLPEWFNLERYEALLSLSVADFIMQMDFRIYADHPFHIQSDLNQIAENPLVAVNIDGSNDQWNDGRCDMATGGAVSPLSNFDLCILDAVARKKGVYGKSVEQGVLVFDTDVPHKDQAFKSVQSPAVGRLPVMINLDSKTDEKILTELAALLPLWREKTNTPEPTPEPERAGFSILKRVIEYQAIPMMDLMLWERVEDIRITNELMALVLFPDYSRSGQHIAQTLRPFVNELMSGEKYEDGLRLAMKKNPYVCGWTVSDFMKWQA